MGVVIPAVVGVVSESITEDVTVLSKGVESPGVEEGVVSSSLSKAENVTEMVSVVGVACTGEQSCDTLTDDIIGLLLFKWAGPSLEWVESTTPLSDWIELSFE